MAEYIEREAAIKCAEKSYKMWNLTIAAAEGAREINKCYKMQEILKAIGETFKIVPAADVAPVVHGRWTQVDDTKCRCSNCDIIALIGLYPHGDKNYCPNCGAKMDGGDTDV